MLKGLKRSITVKRSVNLKTFNRNYPNGHKENKISEQVMSVASQRV